MGQAFIRAYGLHWQRDEVEWVRKGELLGRRNERVDALQLANFWERLLAVKPKNTSAPCST